LTIVFTATISILRQGTATPQRPAIDFERGCSRPNRNIRVHDAARQADNRLGALAQLSQGES
jgi:hypothetical protein